MAEEKRNSSCCIVICGDDKTSCKVVKCDSDEAKELLVKVKDCCDDSADCCS